eukprot:4047788-Alexandrium_andersonii.AAC.1
MAAVRNMPCVWVGDFNEDVAQSTVLGQVLQHGQLHDLGMVPRVCRQGVGVATCHALNSTSGTRGDY